MTNDEGRLVAKVTQTQMVLWVRQERERGLAGIHEARGDLSLSACEG